jgi:demethylmenaquinone methyltransferase/2-methoxy-6-polyprenyl-1,4-benzoquinol methylase
MNSNLLDKISRVSRSKTAARNYYTRLSSWYDLMTGSSEDIFRKQGLEVLDPQVGEKILEIGSGTGKSLLEISNRVGNKGYIFGIDLADGMTDISRIRLEDAPYKKRIAVCIADGANQPLKDNYFDAVFISFTLELFDNPEIHQVLLQCKQVLKEGGRIVIVALKKTVHAGLPEKIYEWIHTKLPVLVDCRPIPSDMYLDQAKFKILDVTTKSMWGLPVDIVSAEK